MSVSQSTLAVWKGEDVTVQCSANCNPNCNIQWKNDEGDNVGTGATLSFPGINRNNHGQYTCEAWNEVGRRSKTSEIIVNCEMYFICYIYICTLTLIEIDV